MEADVMREMFSRAMSAMYRREVLQYGTLLELVATINRRVLDEDGARSVELGRPGERERLDQERHGAIRVGLPEELRLLRRLFAVLGMVPVGYYDLTASGVPVHSTAFRPIAAEALRRSPFRLFTSLLRLDRIADPALRAQTDAILRRRRIVTPRAIALIERFEAEGRLDDEAGAAFVAEALHSFRWHDTATVDLASYEALRAAHPLLADIACFRGPHINHLTPRVLDIDAAQAAMRACGLPVKPQIEGPPRRRCPILLRQTSFRALSEPVRFGAQPGEHTARFGEIEQRGVALTPAGRALYDRLLGEGDAHAFAAFPDDHGTLRREGLAYYRLVATADLPLGAQSLDEAVEAGSVRADPILYEDFLPVSAAGIFRSNLEGGAAAPLAAAPRQDALEEALGCDILDPFALYAAQSAASAQAIAP